MKAKPDPQTTQLHRALNCACRELSAREITLRYLPPPALTRWIATALIVHHRVLEKIREDIPAGELTMQDIDAFNDQPIARGAEATPVEAVKSMLDRPAAGDDAGAQPPGPPRPDLFGSANRWRQGIA